MLHVIDVLARVGAATVLALGPAQPADGGLSIAYACTSPTLQVSSGGALVIELQQNSVAGSVVMSAGAFELTPGCIPTPVHPQPDDLFSDSFE